MTNAKCAVAKRAVAAAVAALLIAAMPGISWADDVQLSQAQPGNGTPPPEPDMDKRANPQDSFPQSDDSELRNSMYQTRRQSTRKPTTAGPSSSIFMPADRLGTQR